MTTRPPPPHERSETVALTWPLLKPAPEAATVATYAVHIARDRAGFTSVQAAIGWHVTEQQWELLSSELVEGSMVFVRRRGVPVAVACGLARSHDWVELAWVAVAPEHRARGVGTLVCTALVRHLLAAGRTHLFGSTQDERLGALKIYLDLGFEPVHHPDKLDRWRAICANLQVPYAPAQWQWPSDG